MRPFKIGIQLKSLRLPFKKALAKAAELGAEAVEVDARDEVRPSEMSQTGVRQLKKMLGDLGLSVCAVSFRTRRGYQVLDDLDARVEATKKAMTMAYQLGTPVVINQVGRVPEDTSSPEFQLLSAVLTDLGNFGNRAGAWLAAETGTEPPATLRQLLDHVPEASIGVNLDPGNLVINNFSVEEAIHELGRLVRHVHAKDGVRDLAQGRGVEVPLGRGTADFAFVLAALDDLGYQGYVTVEREKADDPVAEVAQAVTYLKNLVE